MAHAIIHAEKLAVGRLLFVAIVVRFVLAKLTSVGDTLANSLRAVAVVHALTALCDGYALSTVKAVVISAFTALNFTLKSIVPIGALTVLVV
jgi:hypothetical protein